MNGETGTSSALQSIPPARSIPLAILTLSVGGMAVAYAAQYGFGLEPCVLCFYQRLPYALAGLLALVAFGLPAPGPRAVAVGLCGVVFLAGSAIAFYHVGVEQHWWTSVVSCGGELGPGMTIEEMQRLLSQKPPKPCDVIDWSLFGLTLAGYNALASLVLAVGSLAGARLMKTGTRP